MQVEWKKQAQREVRAVVIYGVENFGERTAVLFYQKIKLWAERLVTHPELGSPEPLLAARIRLYRSLIVSEHHKLIYYIDEQKQIIYIADLWDMRREPSRLSRRLK
ncbi:MAG: type II toxin-antitoxin system RelE/ParE family toxin [Bacteroides sp.]|nr:type II toxin-antitoxin system RelE/ParE family toxin [Bacteroides sp.]